MQNVNSTSQFENLKRTLLEEDRQIKETEDKIRRKMLDHKKAKEVFDKVDREVKELETEKNELIHRRTTLQAEFKNMEKEIHEMNRRGGIDLKI